MIDPRTARLGIVIFGLLFVVGPAATWASSEEPISGFDFLRRSLEIRGLQLEIADHVQNHRVDEAIETLETALDLLDPAVWPMRRLIDENLALLADLYVWQGRYPKAAEVARRRLDLLRAWSAPDLDLAAASLKLGQLSKLAGDPAALGHLEEARTLRAARLGDDHPDTAEVDQALGVWFFEQGDLVLARKHLEQARSMLERHYHPRDSRLSTLLVNLAALERASGRFPEARALLERALEIESAAEGEPSLGSAQVRSSLGILFFEMGSWEEARPVLEEALEISSRWFGEDHPELLTIHLNLAMVLAELGELESSERHARRASDIGHAHLGERHRLTLECRYVLGIALMRKGSLTEAERLLSGVLVDREAVLDRGHIDIISTRISLGQVLEGLGRDSEALASMERALLDLGDSEHPSDWFSAKLVVIALETLARHALDDGSSQQAGEWPGMAELAGQLAAIFESIFGEDSLAAAELHQAMAMAALAFGRGSETAKHRERARSILERPRYRSHPKYASWLANETNFLRHLGDLEAATASMRKALDAFERIYGEASPWTVQPRIDLASMLELDGQIEPALDLLEEAMAIEEREMISVLAVGSERDQRRFLRTMEDTLLLAVTLHQRSAPSSSRARDLALRTVLRRKAIDLDAASMRSRLALAAEDASARKAIRQLEAARARWSRFVASGREDESIHYEEIEGLERKIAGLLASKVELSETRLAGPDLLDSVSVSIEQIQSALPEGSILVEWVSIEPPDVRHYRNEPERYVAYLLPKRGALSFVDLGPAEPIDKAVDAFMDAIERRDPRARQRGRELYDLALGRLEPQLGGFERWILSPVGELHRVPFAALVDGDGRYLVERCEIGYVSSGRDLVQLTQPAPPSREGPWILAGPAFGRRSGDAGGSEAEPATEGGIASLSLPDLPGFHAEARLLAELLEVPASRLLSGSLATEAALRSVAGPSVLHVATHGFLLPDSELGGGGLLSRSMARAGLALTGIRDPDRLDSRDDGFVSALELASIDLRGTQVATLSACRTGQGEPMGSHGLFGLRRALALAGARTQLTSLWSVEDRAAVELMESWYAQILEGVPRGRALRNSQLAMLKGSALPGLDGETRGATRIGDLTAEGQRSRGRHHPYYWAVFTVAGDLGSLPESMGKPRELIQ